MLFLILSIICSVTVGVLFKSSRGIVSSNTQIIASNYIAALFFCYIYFSPNLRVLNTNSPWNLYTSIGILLPLLFLFLAASIKHMGIVKTDAAQRLSLFIPILAAWLFFKEDFNTYKVAAILIAFPALMLLLSKKSDNSKNKWGFPAAVLIGFGVIDILFKQIAITTDLPFTTSLFVIFGFALAVSSIAVIYEIGIKKIKLNYKNILFGFFIGIFNFGNILFYLKAHQAFAKNPSTVFAGMNMGVLIIGSLVGLFIFKEKLTKTNFIGLFLALIAVILIVISQS
jgi:drug/metabolite transporter (DMT)-like permease